MPTEALALPMSVTPDPPAYSSEDWDNSPASAHFEESTSISSPTNHRRDFTQRLDLPISVQSHQHLGPQRPGIETPPPSVVKVFTYNIQRKGQTWAELKVMADELVSGNTPTFVEGSRIQGEVKLYATRSETIYSVVVSVSDFLRSRAPLPTQLLPDNRLRGK